VCRQDCTLWQALVVALACGALAMCAMWVGFPSSLLWVGRKNKIISIKFAMSFQKNPFYFQFITIVSVWSSVFLHLLPTVSGFALVGF